MSENNPDFSPLTNEQIEALTESQKSIFAALDESDRLFFAENFSEASLGAALEKKWQTIQSKARIAEFDSRIKQKLAASANQTGASAELSAQDLALGAAGIAGAVGIGALASQIAPSGQAVWRGVEPKDLILPLVNTFSNQPKTDIRFDAPTAEGVVHGAVYLKTSSGSIPGLTITLTPFNQSTQVTVSKLTSSSLMEALKSGSSKILEFVQEGLLRNRSRDKATNLFNLAGSLLNSGIDIAQMIKDLDLEDKAWETIQRTADPLQKIYDEQMVVLNERRLLLEKAWDDYRNCPKCAVPFRTEDTECWVCGTPRPDQPSSPDPRSTPV